MQIKSLCCENNLEKRGRAYSESFEPWWGKFDVWLCHPQQACSLPDDIMYSFFNVLMDGLMRSHAFRCICIQEHGKGMCNCLFDYLWIPIMGIFLLLSLNNPHALSYVRTLHPSLGVFCLCGRPLTGEELQMMLYNRQETEYRAQQVSLTCAPKQLYCNNSVKSYLEKWLPMPFIVLLTSSWDRLGAQKLNSRQL